MDGIFAITITTEKAKQFVCGVLGKEIENPCSQKHDEIKWHAQTRSRKYRPTRISNPTDDAFANNSLTPAIEDRHCSTYDAVTAHPKVEPDVAGPRGCDCVDEERV